MAQRRQQTQDTGSNRRAPKSGPDTLGITTLAGVAVVMVVSLLSLREVQRMRADFAEKLDGVDDRIAQVTTGAAIQPAPAAQPARPPRRGPDPNRVYPIKTAGSPTKGPASAPVTIAEFSDFQ